MKILKAKSKYITITSHKRRCKYGGRRDVRAVLVSSVPQLLRSQRARDSPRRRAAGPVS